MSINTSAINGFLLPEDTKWDDVGAKYDKYGDFWDRHSPPYDDDLARFFQPMIVGMTGLVASNVRPRWQPVPPNMPAQDVNWCAFGAEVVSCDTFAFVGHRSKNWDEKGAKFDSGGTYTDGAGGPAYDAGVNYDTGSVRYDVGIPQYDISGQTWDDGQTFDYNAAALEADVLQTTEELEILCSFYGPIATRYASRLRDGWQIAQNREPLQLNNMGFITVGPMRSVPELINNLWFRRVDLTFSIRRQVMRAYPVLNVLTLGPSQLVVDQPPIVRPITINPPEE